MRLAWSLCIILSWVFCGILWENGGGTNREEAKMRASWELGFWLSSRCSYVCLYTYICHAYECMYYLQMDGYSVWCFTIMSCNAAPYLARGLHCTYISLVAEHLTNPASQLGISLCLCMYISCLGTQLFHVLHIRANVRITCASVILRNVTAATAVLEEKRCSALANLSAVRLNILHAISPLPWGKWAVLRSAVHLH